MHERASEEEERVVLEYHNFLRMKTLTYSKQLLLYRP